MKRSTLLGIFLRSLTIQASFNFWRMQHLGFAFAMLPAIRKRGGDPIRMADSLALHLQMFNTHPYMAAPVIGAVARLEEEGRSPEAADLKKALMGPYAAIGDPFFWGALRFFAAAGAVIAAWMGSPAAPFAFLAIYSPFHFWIRGKGFVEGYHRGKGGIGFIRGLDLPAATVRLRFLSLILIGLLAAAAVQMASGHMNGLPGIPARALALVLLVLYALGIHKGISPLGLLYGTTLLCMVISF